jgi:hypothetical protein
MVCDLATGELGENAASFEPILTICLGLTLQPLFAVVVPVERKYLHTSTNQTMSS